MHLIRICLNVNRDGTIGLVRPEGFFLMLYEYVIRSLTYFLVMVGAVSGRLIVSRSNATRDLNGRGLLFGYQMRPMSMYLVRCGRLP